MITVRRRFILVLVAAGVAGCASIPLVEFGQAEASLPTDASAYVSFRPGPLRASFELLVEAFGVSADEIGDVLDRSDRVVAAIGDGDADDAFFAVAEGRFPAGWVRFGLALSRSWSRQTVETAAGSRRYYQERAGVSQIAVPSTQVLMISNGRVPDMLQRLAAFESGPDVFSLDPSAELVLLLPRITPQLRQRLPGEIRTLPFESAQLAIHERTDDQDAYTVSGGVSFNTEQAAVVFNVIGRLVIATLSEGVGIRDISVERAGRRIQFDGMRVTGATIEGWIGGFADAVRGTETEQ